MGLVDPRFGSDRLGSGHSFYKIDVTGWVQFFANKTYLAGNWLITAGRGGSKYVLLLTTDRVASSFVARFESGQEKWTHTRF